ncbi:tripartite tricarboxylate transporter substrate binding protein [Arthrobacter luteolus]|uniref:tripartite tricarboxylate transporter substrate binding protein n=1 Tax=Arthrobacter luteolus TaxID=98672 RepID=UPI00082EC719|nr:tripartite tricarboxylate transporter substrate binding protein [Arthrobacter luteolus]
MEKSRSHLIIGVLAASAIGLTACGSSSSASDDAAGFPEKDITFIVQAAAGGGSDLTSRALAAELEKELGVSVVVENRPGASGSTAMQYIADSDTDGYTIGFVPVEISMLGHQGFDIDPANYDFLGQIMLSPGVVSVPADSPYKTLEDLIEAGKEKPLNMANSGPGSIWEAAELGMADAAGTQVVPVPFDGGAPAVAAVIGNQVDGAVGGTSETSAAHDAGQVRALAVLHNERHPMLPDVPTASELGYDLQFGGWGGVYAPAGLPDEVREALTKAIETSAQSETFVETISKGGALPVYKSPKEFTDFINSEYERFGKLLAK